MSRTELCRRGVVAVAAAVLLFVLASITLSAQSLSLVKPLHRTSVALAVADSGCLSTNCISVELGGYRNFSFQVVGTCGTCTVQFETSSDGATWVAVNMLPVSGTQTAVTSTAAAGIWQGAVTAPRVRARMSAWASGSFIVTFHGTM